MQTCFLRGTIVLLFFLIPLPALASVCWDGVTEQHETGFDFVIESEVQGPTTGGAYTYTYRIYRIDEGQITYRDPSHFTIRFLCDSEAAEDLIVGDTAGLNLSGSTEHVESIEIADSPAGFAEPGLGQGCDTNGIKIEFSDGALVPDGDGVSYPDDPDDPVLVISFVSLGSPHDGQWFVKGGRLLTRSPRENSSEATYTVSFLTDGGHALVPGCRPPVAVQRGSWGVLKQIYN